jgi:hypothetical protein
MRSGLEAGLDRERILSKSIQRNIHMATGKEEKAMPAFDEDDIRNLEQVLTRAARKARAHRIPVSLETLARRLLDVACTGERDPSKLIARALDNWDGDDFFPPALGLRPPPSGEPIWQPPSLAA